MFNLNNQLELRKILVSSLVTCIYLPSIITVVSYKGQLYSVGNGSSFYILVLIFLAELLKSFYLSSNDETHVKKTKRIRVRDVLKALSVLVSSTFFYFIFILLFGAAVLELHEETLMLSALLTLLTGFPLIAYMGSDNALPIFYGVKSYGQGTIIEMLVNNGFFAIGGSWLGALVIPLDWNMPWQKWPIPCYLGALGGFLFSNVLTVFKLSLMSAAYKYPVLKILVNMINTIQIKK